jgi:uncharacterized protein (TIGR03435 family)
LRPIAWFASVAFLSGAAFSQPAETRNAFEFADIHTAAPARFPFMEGPFLRASRYEIRTATMVDLIAAAYGVEADNVWGGPSWLENDRFDIIAKAPPNSKQDALKPMLQSLLADRFHLAVHEDKKPMPAFVLTAGKHAQLKKADGSGETGCKFKTEGFDPQGGGPPTGTPTIVYTCRNISMEAFAKGMRNMAAMGQFLNGNPVVDQTELQGAWDFTFKYSLRSFGPAASGSLVTLFDAMDKQLGLKLEPSKVPMPVLVVDNVNQKPTANLADIREKLELAPIPTEFEVAVVKVTDPDFKGTRLQIEPNGRVNLRGVTLKLLIQQVWNLSDDMIVGAPKWMDSDRFDIVGKPPASALTTIAGPASGPNRPPPIAFDTVLGMVKSLLAERFNLVTHIEERPISAYTLLAVKPRMKKADPASRTRYKEGPAEDGKDPRNKNPILGRLVTCQNLTMAQFAEKLQSIAPGYIHSPVLDATGLEGGWDFTLSFSPVGLTGGGGGGDRGRGGDAPATAPPPSSEVLTASDPNGAISLPEAIEKQLGLKLELQKRPASILVIDHVEQKPVDN